MSDALGGMPMDFSKIPSGTPPAGVIPNFNSPTNRLDLYLAVSCIVVPLSFIFVLLKLYMRVIVMRAPGWDDLATVIAQIGITAFMGIYIWLLNQGAGRHAWDTPLSIFIELLDKSKTMAIIQQPTSLFTKLALLGMYYRLFSPKREIKYAIIFGMVICTLIYTTVMFLWIFIKHFHDQIAAVNKINKSQAFLNLSTDIYIFIIPLIAVSGLQMSRAQKLGVATVFMTGLLAVISCIISVVYRFQYMSVTGDLPWQMAPFYVVLTVEISTGIMCSCMPVFPALIQKTGVKKWWSLTFKSLSSKFQSSSTGTTLVSTKKSGSFGSRGTEHGDEYLELKNNDSVGIRKQLQVEVTSIREAPSTRNRDFV